MNIRSMLQEDFEKGVYLISEFYDDSLGEYCPTFELDRLYDVFMEIISTSFVLETDEGEIVGILMGRVIIDLCGSDLVYDEVVWFVTKKYRKYGIKLLKHVQKWCRENGIDRMTMSCMHNSKTETLFKFYERMGFRPVETKFVRSTE